MRQSDRPSSVETDQVDSCSSMGDAGMPPLGWAVMPAPPLSSLRTPTPRDGTPLQRRPYSHASRTLACGAPTQGSKFSAPQLHGRAPAGVQTGAAHRCCDKARSGMRQRSAQAWTLAPQKPWTALPATQPGDPAHEPTFCKTDPTALGLRAPNISEALGLPVSSLSGGVAAQGDVLF